MERGFFVSGFDSCAGHGNYLRLKLLGVVYVEFGITAWFVRRYRTVVVELRREAEGPRRRLKVIGERASDRASVEAVPRFRWGRAKGSR